jgi:hypothetical protein
MKDIKKADWVVVRLLVDVTFSDKERYGGFRPTKEHVNAIMYMHNKYGKKSLLKAIDLIRTERGTT